MRIRSKYESSEIVGTLRAWKVSVDDTVASEHRDAVVSVDQSGGCGSEEAQADKRVGDRGEDGASESLVEAICVRREAKSRSRSVVG